MSLQIPAARWFQETPDGVVDLGAVPGALIAWASALEVRCAPVLGDDAPIGPEALTRWGWLMVRHLPDGTEDAWDGAAWRSLDGLFLDGRPAPASILQPLEYLGDDGWRGVTLVADHARFQRFVPDPADPQAPPWPRFGARCYFERRDGSRSLGVSAKALAISAAHPYFAGVEWDLPVHYPQWIHMFLLDPQRQVHGEVRIDRGERLLARMRDASRVDRARLALDADGGACLESEPESDRRTAVRLDPAGDIHLELAKGQALTVQHAVRLRVEGGAVHLEPLNGELVIDGSVRIRGDLRVEGVAVAHHFDTQEEP